MRIVLVALHFSEYAVRLALALSRTNAVRLVLNEHNARDELSAELRQEMAGRFETVYFRRPKVLRAPYQLLRLVSVIAAFRPDVVHYQEVPSCLGPWSAALLGGRRPIVLTVHDPTPHSGIDSRLALSSRACCDRLRNRADRIIVHGERLAGLWQRTDPAPARRVEPATHGVLGRFPPSPTPAGVPSFLFFGRVEAYKGLGVLLDAMDGLAARGTRATLTIAGHGSDLGTHLTRIRTMPNVTLIDRHIWPDEIAPLFAACTAVVLPYLDATQSGVAALAMGAGRPVIATDVGGLAESVIDGVDGLIVRPRDPVALAAAMARVATDDRLVRTLTLGAAAAATGRLNWNLIADATQTIYAHAIGDADRRVD